MITYYDQSHIGVHQYYFVGSKVFTSMEREVRAGSQNDYSSVTRFKDWRKYNWTSKKQHQKPW